jgi:hypothetical protein
MRRRMKKKKKKRNKKGQCAIGYARTLGLGLPLSDSGCESRHNGFPGEDVERKNAGRKMARGPGRTRNRISCFSSFERLVPVDLVGYGGPGSVGPQAWTPAWAF